MNLGQMLAARRREMGLPEREEKRGGLACPMVMTDTMDPIQSQTNGKMYDSKSALRSEYRRAGVVEVGNDSSVLDPKPFKKPRPDREKIRESVGKAIARVNS